MVTLHAQTLYDRFFDQYYFPLNPTSATSAGIHKYDGKLEDYSRAGVQRQVAALKRFEAAFLQLPAGPERDVVLSNIHARLLEFETIRMWERNPDEYSSGITASAFTIMSRTFAPPEVRLKALMARERQMPKVLDAARANLNNPPRIYTEVAIEQMPGNIAFFERDVPLAFQGVKDAVLRKAFSNVNDRVIQALRNYEDWMKTDLLPRSNGNFQLGPDNYAKKVLYEEMVDIPLDRLLEIGYADLRANQKHFAETAAAVDRNRTPTQILAELEKDHPPTGKLLDAFRDTLSGLQKFIVDKKIVTIPPSVPPILQETPPFMAALTSASMDTPGPYETVATEAFFNVTLPGKDWTPERTEDFLRGFHRGTILSTAIHEAYPGHYVQLLWMKQVPSKVRRLLGAASNIEGWAHYTEQMMLDEGFSSDPLLRLGQLQDALLRDARYICGIEMHTGRKTFDQCVAFFEKEGYQTHEVALRETKRGTSDPTYLVYTLGKLQILKLREDYRKTKGSDFSLLEFHDTLMKQGVVPIKIIRRTMLGNDSPPL